MNDRAVHQCLLDQIEADQASQANVRQILGAAANRAIDNAIKCPAACGSWACNQGHGSVCRAPQACERPEDDSLGAARGLVYAVAFGIAAWGLIALAVLVFHH